MTGWRIGYVAANDQVSKVIANYLSHCTGSPSSISQKAAVTALTASQESVEADGWPVPLLRDERPFRQHHHG